MGGSAACGTVGDCLEKVAHILKIKMDWEYRVSRNSQVIVTEAVHARLCAFCLEDLITESLA